MSTLLPPYYITITPHRLRLSKVERQPASKEQTWSRRSEIYAGQRQGSVQGHLKCGEGGEEACTQPLLWTQKGRQESQMAGTAGKICCTTVFRGALIQTAFERVDGNGRVSHRAKSKALLLHMQDVYGHITLHLFSCETSYCLLEEHEKSAEEVEELSRVFILRCLLQRHFRYPRRLCPDNWACSVLALRAIHPVEDVHEPTDLNTAIRAYSSTLAQPLPSVCRSEDDGSP
jgi:hypothetical protein